MSLLQDPLKALDQIEWYLDSQEIEKFPGAFLLAAGNLCRQILEQQLFILAVYGNLPRDRYMGEDGRLKTAGQILSALKSREPEADRTYLEQARRRGPRIRKFARWPRSLEAWRGHFNEPSHFLNPAVRRRTGERYIRQFVRRMRELLDELDRHLIVAAYNEVKSDGHLRAGLDNTPQNRPAIEARQSARPEDLTLGDRGLTLLLPTGGMRVVPIDREATDVHPRRPVVLQHGVGIVFKWQFVNEQGNPIDLTSMQAALQSLGYDAQSRERVKRRLEELGFTVEWHRQVMKEGGDEGA